MRSQTGLTLLELTQVIAILAIVALVALPQLSATDPARLDVAAHEFAEAIRFARSEAIRRGVPMGFRQQNGQKRMRVYSLDTGTSPWTVIYDVYHPVTKKLWDIKLDEHPFARADTVDNNRVFRGTCDNWSNVYFDPSGAGFCANPETVPVQSYDITLTLGNLSRVVMLDGVSGLVTIQ